MIQSVTGLLFFILIAWCFSENKKNMDFKIIISGVFLQFTIAFIMFKVPLIQHGLLIMSSAVQALQEATQTGTSFIFGYLGGGQLPFNEEIPGSSWILAFRALPLILVVGALSSLLFYWRVIPFIVKIFSLIFQKTMNIGGALSLGVAANIFVGMVESPIIIAPYIKNMTRSEIFTLMTVGMATIAGTVLFLYASFLNPILPGSVGHLVTASIISAPAAILISKVMVPENYLTTSGKVEIFSDAHSSMDAITKGTSDGVKLLINVTAMLLVLVALVSLINNFLGIFPLMDNAPLTLERILGWIMYPVVRMMGIPASEAYICGQLMGTKTVLNELLAYIKMAGLPSGTLSERSILIMTYAMCGFANLGSLGIMIGGLNSIAPERKNDIISLSMKSVIAGTLSTCMTGSVIGVLF